MEILVEEKTENQVKKRKFVKVKKRKKSRNYHPWAHLIAHKRNEEYHHVMNHLRTRLRFVLLKSTLIAIRGERGKSKACKESITELSFNTIPDMPTYEV